MHYRPFGTTGLEISALVFGGGAVGGLLIDKPRETQEKALRLALDSGINWIDTAPSYGDGKSEQTLGHLLKDEANPPHISTKFTIDSRDPDIYGQIEHSLNQSLERLGRQKVTLLQLHNPIVARTDGRSLGLSELLKPHGILDILEGNNKELVVARIVPGPGGLGSSVKGKLFGSGISFVPIVGSRLRHSQDVWNDGSSPESELVVRGGLEVVVDFGRT